MAWYYNKTKSRNHESLRMPAGDIIHPTLRPRVTTCNPKRSHENPANYAVLLYCLQCVVRARRVIATNITIKWRNHCAIAAKDQDTTVTRQQPNKGSDSLHCLLALRSSPSRISPCRVDQDASGEPDRALMITSRPVGRICSASRPIARSRLVTRLRVTELPTAFETMNPKRLASSAPLGAT
jgi:hypothetical protein